VNLALQLADAGAKGGGQARQPLAVDLDAVALHLRDTGISGRSTRS
jgi:hypothetical protein